MDSVDGIPPQSLEINYKLYFWDLRETNKAIGKTKPERRIGCVS